VNVVSLKIFYYTVLPLFVLVTMGGDKVR